MNDDSLFMTEALIEAQKAEAQGEVPVGAVLVHCGEIIARSGNRKELSKCALKHAEMIVIEEASKKLGRWRLHDCSLYVTLEPCVMCAGAIVASRIDTLIYGATDPKAGAVHSIYEVLSDTKLNHRPEVRSGVLFDKCSKILKNFFKKKRS